MCVKIMHYKMRTQSDYNSIISVFVNTGRKLRYFMWSTICCAEERSQKC